MKSATIIALLFLFITPTLFAQKDTAYKTELRKEIKEMGQIVTTLKAQTVLLETSVREADTLILLVKRKRDEVRSEFEALEQLNRDNEKASHGTDTIQMDLTKSHINLTKQLKSGKLNAKQTEQVKQDIAEIERFLLEASLRTDSLKADVKEIDARIIARKKELDRNDKEIERIQSSQDASRQDLDKAKRLIAELEARIAEMKQLLDK